MTNTLTAGLVIAASLALAIPARGDVRVQVNVWAPPIVTAPPPLLLLPGSPVYYAPGYDVNLFVYRGRYYSFYNGSWFYAPGYGAPWAVAPIRRVPRPILQVPATYYRIPPGHAKKLGTRRCPPGLAKQGRCW